MRFCSLARFRNTTFLAGDDQPLPHTWCSTDDALSGCVSSFLGADQPWAAASVSFHLCWSPASWRQQSTLERRQPPFIQVYLMLEQRKEKVEGKLKVPTHRSPCQRDSWHCWGLIMRAPDSPLSGLRLLKILFFPCASRPPSPLLSTTFHPLPFGLNLWGISSLGLTSPTWPDVKLKGKSQGSQDGKCYSMWELFVLKGRQAGQMKQGPQPRLEPARPLPAPGCQSAALPLFSWAQEAWLSQTGTNRPSARDHLRFIFCSVPGNINLDGWQRKGGKNVL